MGLQSAIEYPLAEFGGLDNINMRGRHNDVVSTYKRGTARDDTNAYDKDESSGTLFIVQYLQFYSFLCF